MALVVAAAALGARLFIAGVLLQAAAHKLANRLEFQGIVGQYRLVPRGFEALAAKAVTGLELIAVVALLLAPLIGAALAAALLLGYASAIAINLIRGRAHIDCGCGGESTPLSPSLVTRNLLMVALLVCVVFAQAHPADGPYTIVLGSAFALGLAALYLCYNQLQANAGIYRRLWLGERTG